MPSGAAASMSASSRRLSSRSSGALSWTNSAPARAVARSGSKLSRRAVGALGQAELGQRRPGRVDEVAQPLLGPGGGIPGDHVVPVGEEVRRPAAADDAGARTADGADIGDSDGWSRHAALGLRLSISRASSGVATLAPIASMMRARLLDELGVGRQDSLAQVEVVLEPDADVAAEQHRLRDPRHLHPAQRERGPVGPLGQLLHHRGEQRRVGRGAVRDVHAELEQRRRVDQALLDELSAEPEVAGVEDLHLAAHAELLDALGALAQHVGGADVDEAALAEVEAAAVEGADVGHDLLDVLEPLDAR